MRHGARGATLLVTALLISTISAGAQERLTLEEAIARGVQHSARLADLQAREAAAAAAEQGRGAARLPIVAALAGYTRTNHVDEFSIVAPGVPPRVIYPDVPDNLRARIDLQWPIYTAGRLDALERAARAERGAAAEDLETARADLRLEVTRAFWALVTARESEQVLERSVKNLDVHLGDLRARLDQGLIPPNDVLTAEAQRSRRQGLLIEASNTRAIAQADLRRLIGGTGAVMPMEPTDPGQLSATTSEHVRPERRALDQRLNAARERERAAQAQFRPQLSLAAGYDYARPNPRIFPRVERWDDSWDVSVHASWTLWDGGRRAAERAEAAAIARATESRVTDFDRNAAFEVEARRLDLDSARALILAADTGIRAAEEARRVVDERYRAGVVTSTDVLDAELALLQAQLDRTRAVAAARLAEARLTRALGSPTP
jgi:outer membrane protein TolC